MMELSPAFCWIRYRLATGEGLDVRQVPFESFDSGEARIEASFDGEVLELAITPNVDLTMAACSIGFRHRYADDERVLLNGYQSWTDTAERSVWDKMRGLNRVPEFVKRRCALDGMGDYRFVEYTGRAGEMHAFSYAVFRRGDRCLLLASLDESQGFTLFRTDAFGGVVTADTEVPERMIAAGERVSLARYCVVSGSADEVYDRWFNLVGCVARDNLALVGYTSWYRRFDRVDERGLLDDLKGAAAFFADHPMKGARRVFRLDAGYCCAGDWMEVDRTRFPSGLDKLADRIRAQGLEPGLWIAPFACSAASRVAAEHPDWLLRDDRGRRVTVAPHWGGMLALNTRHPGVRDYVRRCVSTMTGVWGFSLLKADFLYAACMFPHDGMNRGQLMADALGLLREAAGEACVVMGGGVPLSSAFGVLDYARVGCDVRPGWDGLLHMRLLHRERASAKNNIASTRGRCALDGRAFGIDPDVVTLSGDTKLSAERRARAIEASSLGSVLFTSDDMGAWNARQKAAFEGAFQAIRARRGRTR